MKRNPVHWRYSCYLHDLRIFEKDNQRVVLILTKFAFMYSRLLTIFLCLLFGYQAHPQSTAITIDEDYSDWIAGLANFSDGIDNGGGIDLIDFTVTNDENWLYIHFSMDTELDLTDDIIPHTLWLYLDTDDDPSTGFLAQAGYGAELGLNFKEHFAWFNTPNPDVQVNYADCQIRFLPTVSSKQFEFAINRNAMPDGVTALFNNPTIRILFKETNDGDEMPDQGEVFSYTFDETPVEPYVNVELNKINPDLIRVVVYNTWANGLVNAGRVDNFESVVTALSPDIIGFSESGGTDPVAVKNLLDTWLPLGTVDGWYTIKYDDLITCSKWPFLDNWTLWNQFPVLIDLPIQYGTDLLFTNAHLSCCGSDANRQDQVDEYSAFILDAKTAGGNIDLPANTPFVYGGDLNLVGFSQQLTTLITGNIQDVGTYGAGGPLDWDGTDLKDQVCVQSDKRMAYTWRNDGDGYPPGRLDFQIFSDAVVTAAKQFTLQTEIMSAARLTQYSLDGFDTGDASDHFPVIVDYDFGISGADSDGDGIGDSIDNCPDDPNPLQEDWNTNGVGDHCEDSDGDGLLDDDELSIYNTDPGDPDSDNDGLTDGEEVNIYNSDPNIQDTDGDGLTDGLEVNLAGTSPIDPDTDGDGCTDDLEFNLACPDSVCNDCVGDLNSDGLINVTDLLIFLAVFGEFCD